MSGCEKYQELISAMLDGELSTEKTVELNVHLAKCPECRAMYEAFSAVSGAMKDDMQELPAGLHESIMSGVKTSAGKKRGLLSYLRPYASAAACIVVVIAAVLAVRGTGMFGKTGSSAAADANVYSLAQSPAEAPESAAAPADAEPELGSADGASQKETARRDAVYDSGTAIVTEQINDAAAGSVETAEPELDIVSSTVITTGSGERSEETLDRTDSRVWLKTLIESGLKFADGENTGDISYEFTAERGDGSEYTVYMFYDDDGLRASLDSDRADSVPITTLGQFAALAASAE